MFLDRLSIINYKNIAEARLELTARIVCFVGRNGAGKTNVLDAIHYLSVCRSSSGATDRQCVRHGEELFLIEGAYATDQRGRESVLCSYKRTGGKALRRNGKEYGKLSEHIGLVPVVIVSPSDSFLVTDAAEERRRYMNSFLSQTDRSYLAAMVRYNHTLAERNKLLKEGHGGSFPQDILDVLDLQLSEYGSSVHRSRADLVEKLSPMVADYYSQLSGDREQVGLEYRSELEQTPLEQLLAASRGRDVECGFTTRGVHRDDLKMTIGGHPLRRFGSQGQQKSFLLALKLAQYRIIAELRGEKPVLLLDDVFDKLDTDRVGSLLRIVSGDAFGQIFITDCNKVRLENILSATGEGYSLFEVNDGEVSPL